VLEGIVAGVSMLCWPLYAEQKMNKVFMVEEYGIGVEQGLVKAEEVEAKVRLVMESEEGKLLKAREGKCGNGMDGWWLVARCICPVPIARRQHWAGPPGLNLTHL
jgi:hypothetical protein